MPRKSAKSSASENSLMGLPALAVSGSWLSMGVPVSPSAVRPLVVNSPVLKPLLKRLPVRELSIASMMAVKRCSTMGTPVKTSRSVVMLGPLKHVSSTHSSWSPHPEGLKRSSTHMSRSMAAKSIGSASSVNMITRKSTPTPMSVVSIPDLMSILAVVMSCSSTV